MAHQSIYFNNVCMYISTCSFSSPSSNVTLLSLGEIRDNMITINLSMSITPNDHVNPFTHSLYTCYSTTGWFKKTVNHFEKGF